MSGMPKVKVTFEIYPDSFEMLMKVARLAEDGNAFRHGLFVGSLFAQCGLVVFSFGNIPDNRPEELQGSINGI